MSWGLNLKKGAVLLAEGVSERNQKPEARSFWLDLFWTFFKIGAMTLGGGYAMIPLIYRETVEHRRWLEKETFFAGTVLAQAAPGANAVNTAAFVGYRRAGLVGAVVAAVACILPPFLIILGFGCMIFRISALPPMAKIFQGLRAGIFGLLFYVLVDWSRPLFRDLRGLMLCALTLFALLVLKWHPIAVIVLGSFLGFAISPGKDDGREEAQKGGAPSESL